MIFGRSGRRREDRSEGLLEEVVQFLTGELLRFFVHKGEKPPVTRLLESEVVNPVSQFFNHGRGLHRLIILSERSRFEGVHWYYSGLVDG